jgi:hypothetical protein
VATGDGSDGSVDCGVKALEAKSLGLAAVETALLVSLLNTRLAAAKGVSSPALAGASSLTSRLGTSSGAGSSISLPPLSSELKPWAGLRLLLSSTVNGLVGRLMVTQIEKGGNGELR